MTAVLVLFCASCGSILGAADVAPHYPNLGRRRRHAERASATKDRAATP
jgi:hypothetical protein